MVPPQTRLGLSGDRVLATYAVFGDLDTAKAIASDICEEQTIEFPRDLVVDQEILDGIMGRIEDVRRGDAAGSWHVDISYAVEVSAFQIPQLLNMLYGNISLRPRIRLVNAQFPRSLTAVLTGPRFGVAGIRALVGARERPLTAAAIKPMGLPIDDLAAMAGDFAAAGIDVIKDDHGLSCQPFAAFRQRVGACAAAIATAKEEHGSRTLYMPSMNVPITDVGTAARFAIDAGAQGLMVLPGLHGFDIVRALAQDDSLAVPIMAHPSLLGSYVVAEQSGIAHGLLFGTLARLAGADVSVFPNHGGRFSFSPQECLGIADALAAPLGDLKPALPAPAGGMTVARASEVAAFYGQDVMLLIGGDLSRGDRRQRARDFSSAVA